MINFSQFIEAGKALGKNSGQKSIVKGLLAVTLLCISLPAISNETYSDQLRLTDEQRYILNTGTQVPAEYIEALNQDIPIPLITFKVSAARQTTNTDQFEILATYNSMGFSIREQVYTVEAPSLQGLDFSAAIKKKCEESPQQFFDSMIVDGSLGFNVSW